MIVHDLNFKRVAFIPVKADPPLVVDSNIVPTSPIAGLAVVAKRKLDHLHS